MAKLGTFVKQVQEVADQLGEACRAFCEEGEKKAKKESAAFILIGVQQCEDEEGDGKTQQVQIGIGGVRRLQVEALATSMQNGDLAPLFRKAQILSIVAPVKEHAKVYTESSFRNENPNK